MCTSFCPTLLLGSILFTTDLRLSLLAGEALLNLISLLLAFQITERLVSNRAGVIFLQICVSVDRAPPLTPPLLSLESSFFTSRGFNMANLNSTTTAQKPVNPELETGNGVSGKKPAKKN